VSAQARDGRTVEVEGQVPEGSFVLFALAQRTAVEVDVVRRSEDEDALAAKGGGAKVARVRRGPSGSNPVLRASQRACVSLRCQDRDGFTRTRARRRCSGRRTRPLGPSTRSRRDWRGTRGLWGVREGQGRSRMQRKRGCAPSAVYQDPACEAWRVEERGIGRRLKVGAGRGQGLEGRQARRDEEATGQSRVQVSWRRRVQCSDDAATCRAPAEDARRRRDEDVDVNLLRDQCKSMSPRGL